MKTLAFGMLGWMLATGALAADRVLVLVTAGDVDSRLADQVAAYLTEYSGLAIQRREPSPMQAGQSLEQIARVATYLLKENEFGVIVLARPDTPQPQGVCLPDQRFGILNIARLEVDASEERLVRRAGQDGLRVISMLLGMSACPFPLCVLTGYSDTPDLDTMSGNYCPPCHDRVLRLAKAAGLALAVESSEPAGAEDAPTTP